MQQRSNEDQPQMELSSVLLIIMYVEFYPTVELDANFYRHRVRDIDPNLRRARLRSFVEPLRQAWMNEQFRQLLTSFGGFCKLLGLDQVHPYLQTRQAQRLEDWSAYPLDEEGKRIQSQMNSRFQVMQIHYRVGIWTDSER